MKKLSATVALVAIFKHGLVIATVVCCYAWCAEGAVNAPELSGWVRVDSRLREHFLGNHPNLLASVVRLVDVAIHWLADDEVLIALLQ